MTGDGGSPVHVVAMPYPGRGHINPMLNLCNSLASRSSHTLFTFILTEEWFGLIGSVSKHPNIKFATIPNVIPSEFVRGAQFLSFLTAVQTKMEEPFERLIDRLELPVSLIIADTFLKWAVHVGNQRNIPVASLWTMPVSVFAVFYHSDLLVQNQHFDVDLSERGNECVDYIPGLSPMLISDLPTIFFGEGRRTLPIAIECVSLVHKAQYLLFTSIYELESEPIDALKAKLSIPIYTVGPNIPYLKLKTCPHDTNLEDSHEHLKWLDSKSPKTVLYVSLGSFCSVSSAQMDEIAAGLQKSRVSYLWVAREESCRLSQLCESEGLVVPWCDQLRVMCHPSIGGFLTHCGWGSTMESVFAGVPMITFPLNMDQVPSQKLIVEHWKNGLKLHKSARRDVIVTSEEIAELVKNFMDLENQDMIHMMKNAEEIKSICRRAIEKDGSSYENFDSFIGDVLK